MFWYQMTQDCKIIIRCWQMVDRKQGLLCVTAGLRMNSRKDGRGEDEEALLFISPSVDKWSPVSCACGGVCVCV